MYNTPIMHSMAKLYLIMCRMQVRRAMQSDNLYKHMHGGPQGPTRITPRVGHVHLTSLVVQEMIRIIWHMYMILYDRMS